MGSCRFTLEARNALNGLTYALPLWGVRFGERVGDGGVGREWAAIFDTRRIDHAFLIVAAESDKQLGLYDGRGEALGTFEKPAELVSALRCWL
jgi:hypothetical protein